MKPSIRKVLYATDLSENSDHALQYAVKLAMDNDADIIILHVIEEELPPMPVLQEAYLTQEQRTKYARDRKNFAVERIKKQCQTFCERTFGDDPKCMERLSSIEICTGYPAEMILKMVDDLNCDVIVMGTHGKGFLSQTFLGSVAKRVLRRSRKPVFIVPLTEK